MTRRVVGFVDGQNLFYAAKQAFGYTYPNYDPRRLTEVVAEAQGWTVAGIRFYTGVPDRSSGGVDRCWVVGRLVPFGAP
jgi:hypothetical protein